MKNVKCSYPPYSLYVFTGYFHLNTMPYALSCLHIWTEGQVAASTDSILILCFWGPCGFIACPKAHPDSKVHWAHMGPTWGRQDPGGPHVGPMNLAIWAYTFLCHIRIGSFICWSLHSTIHFRNFRLSVHNIQYIPRIIQMVGVAQQNCVHDLWNKLLVV